jgi:hypothetical protein
MLEKYYLIFKSQPVLSQSKNSIQGSYLGFNLKYLIVKLLNIITDKTKLKQNAPVSL